MTIKLADLKKLKLGDTVYYGYTWCEPGQFIEKKIDGVVWTRRGPSTIKNVAGELEVVGIFDPQIKGETADYFSGSHVPLKEYMVSVRSKDKKTGALKAQGIIQNTAGYYLTKEEAGSIPSALKRGKLEVHKHPLGGKDGYKLTLANGYVVAFYHLHEATEFINHNKIKVENGKDIKRARAKR